MVVVAYRIILSAPVPVLPLELGLRLDNYVGFNFRWARGSFLHQPTNKMLP